MTNALSLLAGWLLDLVLGDPQRLPHPVVGFGKMIAFGEHRLNHGQHRKLKGALMAIILIIVVFLCGWLIRRLLSLASVYLAVGFDIIVPAGGAHRGTRHLGTVGTGGAGSCP